MALLVFVLLLVVVHGTQARWLFGGATPQNNFYQDQAQFFAVDEVTRFSFSAPPRTCLGRGVDTYVYAQSEFVVDNLGRVFMVCGGGLWFINNTLEWTFLDRALAVWLDKDNTIYSLYSDKSSSIRAFASLDLNPMWTWSSSSVLYVVAASSGKHSLGPSVILSIASMYGTIQCFSGQTITWSYPQSPVQYFALSGIAFSLLEDIIYVQAEVNSQANSIYALRVEDGVVTWSYTFTYGSYGSTISVSTSGDILVTERTTTISLFIFSSAGLLRQKISLSKDNTPRPFLVLPNLFFVWESDQSGTSVSLIGRNLSAPLQQLAQPSLTIARDATIFGMWGAKNAIIVAYGLKTNISLNAFDLTGNLLWFTSWNDWDQEDSQHAYTKSAIIANSSFGFVNRYGYLTTLPSAPWPNVSQPSDTTEFAMWWLAWLIPAASVLLVLLGLILLCCYGCETRSPFISRGIKVADFS